jgi:hypothetical protein
MKTFKVYRPNLSDYKVVEGNLMTVTEEGKTNIWKDGVIVASIPNNMPVIEE